MSILAYNFAFSVKVISHLCLFLGGYFQRKLSFDEKIINTVNNNSSGETPYRNCCILFGIIWPLLASSVLVCLVGDFAKIINMVSRNYLRLSATLLIFIVIIEEHWR